MCVLTPPPFNNNCFNIMAVKIAVVHVIQNVILHV